MLRLVTFEDEKGARVGLWQDEKVLDLYALWSAIGPGSPPFWLADMLELIDAGPSAVHSLYGWWESISAKDNLSHMKGVIPGDRIRLLAPIPKLRRNMFCVGLNYAAHAQEGAKIVGRSSDPPEFPVFFTKAPTAVIGPNEPILLDSTVTQQLDFEVELGVVIGIAGKNINAARALEHVFGYTVINDISARDVQRRYGQWFKGKSLDNTSPMGPYLVPAQEISDPHNLEIGLRLNGEVMQKSNTCYFIFNLPVIIAELSKGMTLEVGDVIATGTPGGVGFARNPPIFLKAGDRVEAWVELIGRLENQVQTDPWNKG